jgi:hypothetical protein
MKETLREGSFTGDPKRYVKLGSEMGVCFNRGPAFGEHGGGGCFFLTAFLFRGISTSSMSHSNMMCTCLKYCSVK